MLLFITIKQSRFMKFYFIANSALLEKALYYSASKPRFPTNATVRL
jgi:hypothetical protein